MEKKVENIRKVKLNGRDVKMFDVRELKDHYWLFVGTFSAPVRTANKNLLAYAEERSGYEKNNRRT